MIKFAHFTYSVLMNFAHLCCNQAACLKHLCHSVKFPSPLLQSVPSVDGAPGSHKSGLRVSTVSFSKISYAQNHTICRFLCLTPFTQHHSSVIHAVCFGSFILSLSSIAVCDYVTVFSYKLTDGWFPLLSHYECPYCELLV